MENTWLNIYKAMAAEPNPEFKLDEFKKQDLLYDPRGYFMDEALSHAVTTAVLLGQPLLVTGDPGTGKTQLAWSIAHRLNLPPPLVFNAKTTSTARDLFYRYDSLGHFHAAQVKGLAGSPDEISIEKFIDYEALGLAVFLSMPPKTGDLHLPDELKGKGPVRSVVLIDEVDKAPRDFPNDILNEIEHMCFTVRETGKTYGSESAYRPILVLTSNSDKNLPDAFLRRCIYHNIEFPEASRLKEIVCKRLSLDSSFAKGPLDNAIDRFLEIRKLTMKKQPATAELINWICVLAELGIDVNNLKAGETEKLARSGVVIAKNKEDAVLVESKLV